MEVVLVCGRVKHVRVGSSTTGLCLAEVKLKSDDLLGLLDMGDEGLREWLMVLRTRFGPQKINDD